MSGGEQASELAVSGNPAYSPLAPCQPRIFSDLTMIRYHPCRMIDHSQRLFSIMPPYRQ